MDYYVAWTHSDPVYQNYLPDARVLVGPPNVNLAWRASVWQKPPAALIIDSGAYQYYRAGKSPTPDLVLARQLNMVAGMSMPVAICHLDVPLIGARSVAERAMRIRQNLQNARWLTHHTRELPQGVQPIGVIQGDSVESIYESARSLADMGYQSFALGSLARMVAGARLELLRRVEAALEAIGDCLHILGVSSAAIIPELARIGVQSFDSGAPAHEAWRGGIIYSTPYRRYKIASPHFREWARSYGFAEILNEPLPCDCPVCCEDSSRLLLIPGKLFVNLRAIHNCYHLMRVAAGL